jgi:trk system potassium uptake protein TrkH
MDPSASSDRRPYAATGGALLAASPVPWALLAWGHPVAASPWWSGVALASGVGLAVAGLLIGGRPRVGRNLAAVSALLAPTTAVQRFLDSPALALTLALALLIVLGSLLQLGSPLLGGSLRRTARAAGRVRGSAIVAATLWLFVTIGIGRTGEEALWAAVASSGIAAVNGARWLLRGSSTHTARRRLVATFLSAALVLALLSSYSAWELAACGAVYAMLTAVFGPRAEHAEADAREWWRTLFEHPERMLVVTFATVAAIGAVALVLPHAAAAGSEVAAIDALFTSVSAVCVTGLSTIDVSTSLSGIGQAALLVLMQIGGLGIMTFSTAALRVLGGRMSMRHESAVARLIGTRDRSRVIASAQDILKVTFVAEAVGAIALTALFWRHGDEFGTALWRGSFTSVSAFCNAGFSLQSDSLVPYRADPLVLHTVAALIIVGGLSPAVVLAWTRRERHLPLAAQARMCLVAAGILLAAGAIFFAVVEWNGTLAGMSVADKIHNAWFQSATLRTAGFNSIDVGAIHAATYVMFLVMMFIGGSPGGTAGGVKTTTVATLMLSTVATVLGRQQTTAFGRRIGDATLRKAAVIVTVAATTNFAAILALLVTQDIAMPAAAFEAVSALATVGLSQGATGSLDEVGKILIMACMFVGRIGGLTVMMFMSQRTPPIGTRLPTEEIDVG